MASETSMRKRELEEDSTSPEATRRKRKLEGEFEEESSDYESSDNESSEATSSEDEVRVNKMTARKTTSRRKMKGKGKGKGKVSVEEEAVVRRGSSIMEILLEQENRPKSVYVCLSRIEGDGEKMMLIHADVHNRLFFDFPIMVESNPGPGYPPHLFQNYSYGVACLGSKVYFIGGCNIPNSILLNDVSVYDKSTFLWNTAPALNQPRPYPVVLIYQNIIHVFGSRAGAAFPCIPSIPLTPDSFIEYYDTDLDKWHYLPTKLPEELLRQRTAIISHAFSEVKGVAFFWVHAIGIYSYDFKSRTWAPFKFSGPGFAFHPIHGLRWSPHAVFVDSFLIWHHFGTIYSFNLSNHALRSIFTFPKPFQKFGNPYAWKHNASPSYLVNVGNGKLCLVYGCQHHKDLDSIRCHVFDMQYSRTSPDEDIQLSLTHDGCQIFDLRGYMVSSVFTEDLVEEMM